MNEFDPIAPYYDRLAKIVFGDALHRSQAVFVSCIPQGAKVLILGGGAGKNALMILEKVRDVSIVYVEASAKMIAAAKDCIPTQLHRQVQFVHDDFARYAMAPACDVVVAHCFFDLFPEAELTEMIARAKGCMKAEGMLFVSDFQISRSGTKRLWQRAVVWLMLRFFRYSAKLETHRLADIQSAILKAGFLSTHHAEFGAGLIFSRVFIKTGAP